MTEDLGRHMFAWSPKVGDPPSERLTPSRRMFDEAARVPAHCPRRADRRVRCGGGAEDQMVIARPQRPEPSPRGLSR